MGWTNSSFSVSCTCLSRASVQWSHASLVIPFWTLRATSVPPNLCSSTLPSVSLEVSGRGGDVYRAIEHFHAEVVLVTVGAEFALAIRRHRHVGDLDADKRRDPWAENRPSRLLIAALMRPEGFCSAKKWNVAYPCSKVMPFNLLPSASNAN